jgi:hypothetical protein
MRLACIRPARGQHGRRRLNPMMPIHTTHTRDAALRELHRINRWLLAGSVLLTGALTDVAAHAFPGKTLKQGAISKPGSAAGHAKAGAAGHAKAGARNPSGTPSKPSSKALAPPAEAPRAVPESSSPQQSAPAQESAPTQESAPAQESAPTQESAPAQESTPVPESSPPAESAPESEPASEPVVSGGS